ncbi:hypothetical protein [Kitasatospora sp. CB02891]|uniref:hypothetical protein n=1 Tax=Kitasatospora sp. CB02891 TaxID=2020329 RepID=UPI000CBA739A|nr:hypothetical protein [Kitasatospora sp. CB02891]PJN22419.1 hypothetical protein CG736_28310 [Kitasatospora sp. CB02891]
MSIPASSVPAARLWLFKALAAQLTPDSGLVNGQGHYGDPNASLLVCLDEPGTYQPADIVSVGRVARDISVSSMVGSGGAGWLEEHYTIAIVIEVARGDDAQSAFERAADLVDQVVAVVRTDPTLGGTVLVARPTTNTIDVLWASDHTGRVGQAELSITCMQRI